MSPLCCGFGRRRTENGQEEFCSLLIKVAETSLEGWQSQTGQWGG